MRRLLLIATFLCTLPFAAQAEAWNVDSGSVFSKGTGAVIKGYDPVAYFTLGKATKGSPAFTATHEGAVFYFANEANKKMFAASPAKYTPQYGGFCAYAVSQNSTADIDPTAFAIVGGKLYLNYDADIQTKWQKNQAAFITAANKNWPELSK